MKKSIVNVPLNSKNPKTIKICNQLIYCFCSDDTSSCAICQTPFLAVANAHPAQPIPQLVFRTVDTYSARPGLNVKPSPFHCITTWVETMLIHHYVRFKTGCRTHYYRSKKVIRSSCPGENGEIVRLR